MSSAATKRLYTPEQYLVLERKSLNKHEFYRGGSKLRNIGASPRFTNMCLLSKTLSSCNDLREGRKVGSSRNESSEALY